MIKSIEMKGNMTKKDRIHHEEYIDTHRYDNDYIGESSEENGEQWIQYIQCPECMSNDVYKDTKEIFCKKCGLVIDGYDTDLCLNEAEQNNLERLSNVEESINKTEIINDENRDSAQIYNDLINHFPNGMTPRKEQKNILYSIAKGIEEGYHFFLLDAGTGIGKSAIAATLSEYFGESLITTVTKQLQHQYNDDFEYPVLKGRNNFDCKEALNFNKVVSCEDGICQTDNIVCDKDVSTSKGASFCFEDRLMRKYCFKGQDHCNY